MIRLDRPNYSVMQIDLSNAGEFRLDQAGQRLCISRMMRGGTIAPAGSISVALGAATEDYVSLGMGGQIIAAAERYFFRWPAQPGVTCEIVVSQFGTAEGGLIVTTPPTSSVTVQDGVEWSTIQTHRRGTSFAAGIANVKNTFIRAEDNVRGAIIRTFTQSWAGIWIGVVPSARSDPGLALGTHFDEYCGAFWGRFLVPAGQSATVFGGGAFYSVSWDML